MNKKQILAQLAKLANELDNLGMHDEANNTTKVMEDLISNPHEEGFAQFERAAIHKIRNLFKKLKILANQHNNELRGIDYPVVVRKRLSNDFVHDLIEDVRIIDLTGENYQPITPKKPGFFDKFTSQFDRFKPKQEKQPDNELFNKYYAQSEQVIEEIEKTCREAVSKYSDLYDKRTFISRLEEIKNETIERLEEKLYENIY